MAVAARPRLSSWPGPPFRGTWPRPARAEAVVEAAPELPKISRCGGGRAVDSQGGVASHARRIEVAGDDRAGLGRVGAVRARADAGRPPSPRLSPVLCPPPCILVRWWKAAATTVEAQKIWEGRFILTTMGGGQTPNSPVRSHFATRNQLPSVHSHSTVAERGKIWI
jgi:hypothetical protein